MSREILFRGKSLQTGKWVHGFYCSRRETTYCFKEDYDRNPVMTHHYIVVDEMTDWGLPNELQAYEVDLLTVGQYTGMTDKNGMKIYEGDIVCGTSLGRERTGEIVWISLLAGFGIRYAERDDPTAWQESSILKLIEWREYAKLSAEVIGNIYGTPELLGSKGAAEK